MQNIKVSFIESFKLTLKYYLPLLKKAWLPLGLILIFSLAFKQYFGGIIEASELEPTRKIMAVMGQVLTSITASLFLFLTIPPIVMALKNNTESPKLLSFYRKHDLPLIIESLRVMTKVLLWALLFIIPGLIKQVFYIFVPYVVMFDPRYYNDDNFDPLVESQKLVKGMLIPMIFLMLFTQLEAVVDLISTPSLALKYTLSLFAYFFSVFCNTYFFFLYLIRRDQFKADKS